MFERINLVNSKGQDVFIQLLAIPVLNYYEVNYRIGVLATAKSAFHTASIWGVGIIDDTLVSGGFVPEDIADIKDLILETVNRQYKMRGDKG